MLSRKGRKITTKFRKSERKRIRSIIYAARDSDLHQRRMQAAFHAIQEG